jgi:hypothetical protein
MCLKNMHKTANQMNLGSNENNTIASDCKPAQGLERQAAPGYQVCSLQPAATVKIPLRASSDEISD